MAAMRRAVSGRWSPPAVWGGDQGPGLAPEGVLRRQGLRIGHVQSGPPQAAGLQHLRQGGAGGITAHAGGMGPQGPAQPGEGGAQIPGTHHQHLRVQQGTGLAQVPPLGLPLLVPVLGQALHEGEQHGKQMLRH